MKAVHNVACGASAFHARRENKHFTLERKRLKKVTLVNGLTLQRKLLSDQEFKTKLCAYLLWPLLRRSEHRKTGSICTISGHFSAFLCHRMPTSSILGNGISNLQRISHDKFHLIRRCQDLRKGHSDICGRVCRKKN